MFENNHKFTGELAGMKCESIYKDERIDYKVTSTKERMARVVSILNDKGDFFTEYFDNNYKVSLSQSDRLSEENAVCKTIETLANYILGAEEVREENKKNKAEYRYYKDASTFKNAIKREDFLDGISENTNKKIGNDSDVSDNVINFLSKKTGNGKVSKVTDIKVVLNRLEKELKKTECNDRYVEVIMSYTALLDNINRWIRQIDNKEDVQERAGQRYILTSIKKALVYDMIYCHKTITGLFGEKLKSPLPEGAEPSWELFDWTNEEQVRELITIEKEFTIDDEISMMVFSKHEYYKKLKENDLLTEREIAVIQHLKDGYKAIEIAEELGCNKMLISRTISSLAEKITLVARMQNIISSIKERA